mgnify:CR=1 FL=1
MSVQIHIEPIILSQETLSTLAHQKGTILLESTDTKNDNVSIMACHPFLDIEITQNIIKTTSRKGATCIISENPLTYLDQLEEQYHSDQHIEESPIWGGLFGSFSYEFCRYLDDFKDMPFSTICPDFVGGLYDRLIVTCHDQNQSYYITSTIYEKKIVTFDQTGITKLEKADHQPFHMDDITMCETKETYINHVHKILDYLTAGDIYQVNYSVPFKGAFSGHPYTYYDCLRNISPAPYSAYMNVGTHHIMSSSPELFFKKEGDHITTKPIKGTVKRGKDPTEDEQLFHWLKTSSKDEAELLMITDLERNDLSKLCLPGTVHVPHLRQVEPFAQVFHGVSTIEGKIKPPCKLSETLTALFPGGSITGAPKIRAMEIINELEVYPRGPYTGAIGYMGFNQNAQFNIAIRTAYTIDDTFYFHAGGGIVAESNPESEFEELWIKSKGLMQALKLKNIVKIIKH